MGLKEKTLSLLKRLYLSLFGVVDKYFHKNLHKNIEMLRKKHLIINNIITIIENKALSPKKLPKNTRILIPQKIFILGGRSATTLVHKCILITGLLNWGDWSLTQTCTEAPIVEKIKDNFPHIKLSIFKNGNWDVAKLPEFDLIIDEIIKRFKNPKFLILERDVKERAESRFKLGWTAAYKRIRTRSNFRTIFLDHFGKLPETKFEALWMWIKFMEEKRERELKNYKKKNILRIQFRDLMKDFSGSMKKIADFVDIDYKFYISIWEEMRTKRMQNITTKDVLKHIK